MGVSGAMMFWYQRPATPSGMSAAGSLVQMRPVASSAAERMRLPSGLKATEVTSPRCPVSTAIVSPLAASQMRTVSSPEPVTMRVPSGLKLAASTSSISALRTSVSRPVPTSKTCAVPPLAPVARRLPFGAEGDRVDPLVVWQDGDLAAASRVPQARRLVRRRRRDQRAVRAVSRIGHAAFMPLEHRDLPGCGDFQDARNAVGRSRSRSGCRRG